MSKELNVHDRIHFLGRIPNEELPNYLAKCPLYISTPITEGASSSLMEAMASGSFPIVTNLPGNKSFVHDFQNGILVKTDCSEDLASKILLFNSLASDELTRIALFNRSLVLERMNRDSNMKYFYKKYLELNNQI